MLSANRPSGVDGHVVTTLGCSRGLEPLAALPGAASASASTPVTSRTSEPRRAGWRVGIRSFMTITLPLWTAWLPESHHRAARRRRHPGERGSRRAVTTGRRARGRPAEPAAPQRRLLPDLPGGFPGGVAEALLQVLRVLARCRAGRVGGGLRGLLGDLLSVLDRLPTRLAHL